MSINITEVQAFTSYIEHQTGKKYQTPTDFEQLASDIFLKTKNHISISTLKRLWGYIERRNKVRKSTLDILANYVGYIDFNQYQQEQLKNRSSGYLSQRAILSSSLHTGAILEIGWEPDRLCQLTYQGDNYFQLRSVINSSLITDTIMRISVFGIGEPLYMEDLSDGPNKGKVYIAGKKSGITILRITDDK